MKKLLEEKKDRVLIPAVLLGLILYFFHYKTIAYFLISLFFVAQGIEYRKRYAAEKQKRDIFFVLLAAAGFLALIVLGVGSIVERLISGGA